MGESAEMSFVTSVNVKIRVWSFIANLFPNRIQEQYAKLKLTEEGLQAAQSNCSAREKAAEVRALFAVKGQKYICIQRTLLGFSEVHRPTLSSRSEGSLCLAGSGAAIDYPAGRNGAAEAEGGARRAERL